MSRKTRKKSQASVETSSRNEIMNDTQRIREERLVFYRDEIASIDAIHGMCSLISIANA